MAKKALIVQGGWEGHEPKPVSGVFAEVLKEEGFEVEVSDTLESFRDVDYLRGLDLIIPVWTMGELPGELAKPVLTAVSEGVGLAGCHGGMCDAFRQNVDWQFMTGGQWVAHPGGGEVEHIINIKKSSSSPIVEGIEDFSVTSEQYYLHVDPAVEVIATTRFPEADGPHAANGEVDAPVVWTKRWGEGRVFYCSLGHSADIVKSEPTRTIMRRGFLWASGVLG